MRGLTALYPGGAASGLLRLASAVVDPSTLIPQDATLWLDATQGVTTDPTDAQNLRIASWAARAGSAVSQATTSKMPTVNGVNGLPSVLFNGASELGINAPFLLAGSFTLFCVGVPTASTANHAVMGASTTANGTYINFDVNVSRWRLLSSSGSFVEEPAASGATALCCAQYNASTPASLIRVNRVARNTNNGTMAIAGPADRIGANHWPDRWQGHLCEFLAYARALSAAEISQVEGYLAGKWGIA